MLSHALRDWLIKVDEMDELRRLEGVDWNLEMGAIVGVVLRARDSESGKIFLRSHSREAVHRCM
jgi:hypothetical protein